MSSTVTVTSANSLIGRELVARLHASGVPTVALVRRTCVLPGAAETITDWTTSAATAEAVAAADTVVHLSGEISARDAAGYDAANVATTRIVADALRPGQRIVFVSYLGADPASSNLFLRAAGAAEVLLTRSPADAVIFRTQIVAHALDRPGGFEEAITRAGPRAPVRLIGTGRALVRPVAQVDVVAAILAVVAGRGRPGVHELVGPDALSLDDVVRLYNDADVRISHLPGWLARLLAHIVPGLTPTFVDLFLRPPAPGNPEPAASVFGLGLTPLPALWSPAGPLGSPTGRAAADPPARP